MLPRSTLQRFPRSSLERTTKYLLHDLLDQFFGGHVADVEDSFRGKPDVALAPTHLHGIPARARHLRPEHPVYNPRHVEVCKQPCHALCLHIGLPVDGRPLTTRHLVHPLQPTPPPPRLLCSLWPCFKKRLMLSEMSPENIANPNGLMLCNMASTSCSRLSRYHDALPTVQCRQRSLATAA